MGTAVRGKRTILEQATGRGVRMEGRRTQAKATEYWPENPQSRRGTGFDGVSLGNILCSPPVLHFVAV